MYSIFTKDLYAVLGISPLADRETIRSAHRTLAFQYHPDRTRGDPRKTEMFKIVQEAYDTLSDREKKYSYDLSRSLPSFSTKTPPTPGVDASFWEGWSPNFTGRKHDTPPATPSYATFPVSTPRTSSPPVTPIKCRPSRAAECFVGKGTLDEADSLSSVATPGTPKKQANFVYISSDDEGPPTPSSPTPGRHYTFLDYYDAAYKEKPFFQELRKRAEVCKEKWRSACKIAAKAKADLHYAEPQDKVPLQQDYDAKRLARDNRQRWKKIQDDKLKRHLKRAREVKAARKRVDRQIEEENKQRNKIFKEQERIRKAAEKAQERSRYRKSRNLKAHHHNHQDVESDGEWIGD